MYYRYVLYKTVLIFNAHRDSHRRGALRLRYRGRRRLPRLGVLTEVTARRHPPLDVATGSSPAPGYEQQCALPLRATVLWRAHGDSNVAFLAPSGYGDLHLQATRCPRAMNASPGPHDHRCRRRQDELQQGALPRRARRGGICAAEKVSQCEAAAAPIMSIRGPG